MKPRKKSLDAPVAGELKPDFVVQLRVWWAVIWRIAIGMFILGVLVEVVLRDMLELPRYYMLKAHDAVMLLLIPITFWAAGSVINRSFGRYRLMLIDRQADETDSRLDIKQKKTHSSGKMQKDAASQPNENNTK